MNEKEQIMFDCICGYARYCELNAIVIKSAWEAEEFKLLEFWWLTKLTDQQRAKIKNVMRAQSQKAQMLAQRNLKDNKYNA